jgi:hypothetical protein
MANPTKFMHTLQAMLLLLLSLGHVGGYNNNLIKMGSRRQRRTKRAGERRIGVEQGESERGHKDSAICINRMYHLCGSGFEGVAMHVGACSLCPSNSRRVWQAF